jgi:hypothetical protein
MFSANGLNMYSSQDAFIDRSSSALYAERLHDYVHIHPVPNSVLALGMKVFKRMKKLVSPSRFVGLFVIYGFLNSFASSNDTSTQILGHLSIIIFSWTLPGFRLVITRFV